MGMHQRHPFLRGGSLIAVSLLFVVSACGGDDEASVSDGGAESSNADDLPAGTSAATVTLDGVEYVFDSVDFSQCLVFGERFMGGDATNPGGVSLEFSYEEPDIEADGEGSEYANFVELELADGDESWRAGSITGAAPIEWGTLEWSRSGNTLEGEGMFVDQFAVDSEPVPGEFTITCA